MDFEELELNRNAYEVAEDLLADPEAANVEVHEDTGATIIDCGINVRGSLLAARTLADACLAGWGSTGIEPGRLGNRPCSKVLVEMDNPAIGCLLSQYAGWKLEVGKFLAMASGPMRAILAAESIFKKLDYSEESDIAVGILETSKLPTAKVVEYLCETLNVDTDGLHLLVAPTASLAGSYQVVARSVETCMHKLFEVGFDVTTVRSALGSAFLPPVPKDDLTAIGRTNDSMLYGAEVCLWVEGDDDAIAELGPKIPSSASPDYGEPFAEIFKRFDGDFYKIDPMLFSPAQVVINNLSTGSYFEFGQVNHDLLIKSFFEG